MAELDSLRTRLAFSEFLSYHVARDSLLSTTQVAVAPCYRNYQLVAQSLDDFMSDLRDPVQLSITLDASAKMSSSEEITQQYHVQLRELLHTVIVEGTINDTTRLLRSHQTSRSLLVDSLSNLVIDSVIAAEMAGLSVEEFCIGFDLIPAGPPRIGPTAAWHNHRHVLTPDFKHIREDQFDLTTIFVPVGPTSLVADLPHQTPVEIPVFGDLVAAYRTDTSGLRDFLSEQIYQLEGQQGPLLRMWSPRQSSCLLFTPEAVHRAPLPLTADALASARSVCRELGNPIPYNRAMISVTLLVNKQVNR